jgi:hypothetical protein
LGGTEEKREVFRASCYEPHKAGFGESGLFLDEGPLSGRLKGEKGERYGI